MYVFTFGVVLYCLLFNILIIFIGIFIHYIYIYYIYIYIYSIYIQVHLNKLECRGKVHYFSNSTQIVKLVY